MTKSSLLLKKFIITRSLLQKAGAKEKTWAKFTNSKEKGKGKRKKPEWNLQKVMKKARAKEKKPNEWPVNFLRQIETIEWLHVCYGPRTSRLYDSHPNDSWPDTFYYKLLPA